LVIAAAANSNASKSASLLTMWIKVAGCSKVAHRKIGKASRRSALE
jgi:hypothetical protein